MLTPTEIVESAFRSDKKSSLQQVKLPNFENLETLDFIDFWLGKHGKTLFRKNE